jgi:hypothetical protein
MFVDDAVAIAEPTVRLEVPVDETGTEHELHVSTGSPQDSIRSDATNQTPVTD